MVFISSFSACIAGPTDNVNSASFVVNLSAMDPLGNTSTIDPGIWSFKMILWKVTNILLILIPIIAWVSFLIAGYFYIFSAGDSEKAGRAKTIIKWNIVAIFVALLSFGIVSIVAELFSTP
jgi:hypothetical protein